MTVDDQKVAVLYSYITLKLFADQWANIELTNISINVTNVRQNNYTDLYLKFKIILYLFYVPHTLLYKYNM